MLKLSPPLLVFPLLFLAFTLRSEGDTNPPSAASAPVVITDGTDSVTMENGVVAITVSKANANILSMRYKTLNLMRGGEAYWNVYGATPNADPKQIVKTQVKGTPSVLTITQDPARNGGAIGEFELLFPYRPGSDIEPLDIAIRYTLHRGDSGVYGWTSVTHKAGYPAFVIEASTVCLKLDPHLFDHLTIDSRRDRQMINGYDWMHGIHLNLKEARLMTTGIRKGQVEHKYDYNMLFSETPAWGWSSTAKDVGIWIVNPSLEYMNNGPTRVDYGGHIDLKDSPDANPTLLFIWHSFHYGGEALSINQDENWNKVIGPFLIYCNSGPTPDAMWADALNRAAIEKREWPYPWAKAPGYASAAERGSVSGRLVVQDPQQPSASASNAWVGLAAAPYTAMDESATPLNITWETDGKHYEYWAHADSTGAFTIPNARPGTYVLYAFNNGILGDYSHANVTVRAGQVTPLGTLPWIPVRYGRQIWEIGIPNRSAEEFRHGDHYWQWGLYNLYPKEFPNDVNFVIGQSDWSKDWNYVQPPRQVSPNHWTGTTWKITFNMPSVEPGRKAVLRLALCGTRNSQIDVAVNGHPAGTTGKLPSNSVMHRDGIRATEIYSDIPFDTSLLKQGTNVMELTTHARVWTDGVLYDYLRLEITDPVSTGDALKSLHSNKIRMIPILRYSRNAALAFTFAASVTAAFAGRQGRVNLDAMITPIYSVEGDAFVRHNGDRYSNRPLYCNQIYAIALGGDKPFLQVGDSDTKGILGGLMFALIRNGKGTWLQNASDITSKYRPGRMEWIIKDATWGTTVIHLEEVPVSQGTGLAAHIRAENALPGDEIVWASGGNHSIGGSALWVYDMTSLKTNLIRTGFVPADSAGNLVKTNGQSWTIQRSRDQKSPVTTGNCSAVSSIVVADAGKWEDPSAFAHSQGQEQPIACGTSPLASSQDLYWSLIGAGADVQKSPADLFAAGMRRELAIENQVTVDTPDPWLNAAAGASVNVADACFREGIYSHSGMRWSTPLLGWRTVFGGTVFGWHDNVKTDAKIFIGSQITQSDSTQPHADPAAGLSSQAPDSRMFGKGRIALHHPHHYDMQSQFFDQVQHAWRWTGDPDLEKLMRPSLDLHCEYIKDCFDPESLGIYESYANTWPTDDQWYNGGGTSEETAYAYRAEKTALELAQRANDQQDIQLHTAALERIRNGFFNLLWIPNLGYPGAYREQIGLKRLHESCWLYAIFCPIDAGLLTMEQSAEALQYTEWGLERVKFPYGGEQCWPSNWVPSIWSVREMWSGDNYQLALAYFQTGLADDGWKVLRGTFPQQAIFGPVPGDMGHPSGGTDFNDCNSMFARAIVEGLFGYTPDYPDGIVKVTPQFPSGWNRASIKTPDVTITYHRDGAQTQFKVTLTKASPLEVDLPVSTEAVQSVTVDGKPAKWTLAPGFGRTLVRIKTPSTTSADIAVTCQDARRTYPAVHLSGNTGEPITLKAVDGQITAFDDPQGVLSNAKVEGGTVTGQLTANAGHHVVFATVQLGKTEQTHMFKIQVTNVNADEAAAAKTQVSVPADPRWDQIPMGAALNGDIRTIYRQKYLSPRPNTCSLRLAWDGYSSWQMGLGPKHPPVEIDLKKIPALSDGHGNILAGKNVPFQWPSGDKNIAFTSQWDNWPKQVEIPVNKTGDAVWFLLCGTTDPMEVQIANAELRMTYADGVVEKLPLIPPFNFWTLCPFSGVDYDYERDAFALPKVPPTTVQLGKNCRGIVLGWNLRPGVPLKSVALETQSEEVVIGLMGVTVMSHL